MMVAEQSTLKKIRSTAMKLDKQQLQELLIRLRHGLESHYGTRLRDVRLYGSYARGNAYAGSDVDILVVLAGEVNEFVESEATGDLIAGLSLEYDTVVCCMFLSEKDYRERDLAFFRVVRQESVPV
jgi:predicted nucleotidyltransferase